MEPVFDASGRVVAWLFEQRYLLDLSNRYRAFIRDGQAWSSTRQHLGQFASGFFWDKQGRAVAFVRGATGGPIAQALEAQPEPPVPGVPPLLPLPSLVTPVRTHGRTWSNLTWEAYLQDSIFPERPERRRSGKRLGASFRRPQQP